jgi:6-phosphogluconolactonase
MIEVLEDQTILGARAAALFAQTAKESVSKNGVFTVALSGGTTPRLMFQKLAEQKDHDRIPWDKVYVFWGDERHVPLTDAQSNYKMAKESLLDHVATPHVFPIPFLESADASARSYESTLRDFFKSMPRFDLCFLGLGADGHTASLFPGSAALQERTRWACASQPLRGGPERVTLTFPVFNHAAQICFLVAGGDKATTLKQVIEKTASSTRYPAQDICPEDGTLIWLLDRDAAKHLGNN